MRNPKIIENITQHWSRDQIAARKAAEAELSRDDVKLIMPDYIAADEVAMKYWNSTLEMVQDIDLLDDLDTDTLGTYCILMSRITDLRAVYTKNRELNIFDNKNIETLRKAEAQQLQYAGKLGLTAESRARLAKKRSTPEKNPSDDLYGPM